jgi:hypothetical protein
MHVDLVLYLLSALPEILPERGMDAENNSVYVKLIHRCRCVLRISCCIFETAALTEFVHIT